MYTNSSRKFYKDWICRDAVAQFQLDKTITEKNAIYDIAKKFTDGSTFRILARVIRARTNQVSMYHIIQDIKPQLLLHQEGFLCSQCSSNSDNDKMILWRSINTKGSEHNSPAFKSTELYESLCAMTCDLSSTMLDSVDSLSPSVIGDSVCAI